MNLLITTQAVDLDNPVLAFFHAWIAEFAKHYELVTVVCLEEGRHDLPNNVRIFSLGKEKGRCSRLVYSRKFLRIIARQVYNYDAVFVHMNPEYVFLAGWLWRIWGKKVAFWYTHKAVNLKLRIAAKLAHVIFTASKESFQLPSKKVVIVGHGIETTQFARAASERVKDFGTEPVRILHIGRITPIKNCDTLIEAAFLLKKRLHKKVEIIFAGHPVKDADKVYMEKLKALIEEKGLIKDVLFKGLVPNRDLPELFSTVDLSVNLTPTGGVEKAVLESMAAAVPVLSSNKTFIEYFDPYASELIFKERDSQDLANKIFNLLKDSQKMQIIGEVLEHTAHERADVHVLIDKIVSRIHEIPS